MNNVSCFNNKVFFWRGVVDPRNLLTPLVGQKVDSKLLKKIERIRDILFQLTKNEQLPGTKLEKLKGHNIYSVRSCRKDRILFSEMELKGKKCLLLLDVVFEHKYDRSKFLNPQIFKRFCVKQQEFYNYEELDLTDLDKLSWEEPEAVLHFDYPKEVFDIEYAAVDNDKSKFILFDATQEETLEAKLPVIVNGPPGSGKTSIALSSLIRYLSVEENQKGKKVLYVCASERLIASMHRRWSEHPLSKIQVGGNSTVEFTTYDAITLSLLKNRQMVSKEERIDWLKNHLPQNSGVKGKKKKPSKAQKERKNEEASRLYQEFQVISTCSSKDEYLNAGEKQSLVNSKEEKERNWKIFQDYKTWLETQGKYDSKFCDLSEKGLYDFTVVDESADFAPIALTNLYDLTKDGNIAYFLDTQQDLEDSLSKRSMLEQMMESKKVNIGSISLPSVYRCQKAVVDFANRCLDLKAYLTGGTVDKREYRSVEAASNDLNSQGSAIWSEKTFVEVFEELRKMYDEVDIAIVTDVVTKQMLQEKGDKVLIFIPEEIKGLEFPVVILLDPFKADKFVEINKTLNGVTRDDLKGCKNRPKNFSDEDKVERAVIAPLMSQLFTSVTRAEEKLVICQKVEHKHQNIYRLLCDKQEQEQLIAKEMTSKPLESSEAKWLEIAERTYDNGNMEQFNNICRDRLHMSPEDVKRMLKIECPDETNTVSETPSTSFRPPVAVKKNLRNPESGQSSPSSSSGGGNKKNVKKAKAPCSSRSLSTMEKRNQTERDDEKIGKAVKENKINDLKKVLKDCKARGLSLKIRFVWLCMAIQKNYTDIARTLIENGESVDIKDGQNFTLLHVAVSYGRLQIAKELINKKIDINARSVDGGTPLHLAVQGPSIQLEGKGSNECFKEIVELLVSKGAALDLGGANEYTPLHLATQSDDLEIFKILFKKGARLDSKTKDGQTVVELASSRVLSYLIDEGKLLNIDLINESSALHKFLQDGSFDYAKKIIELGADVNALDAITSESPIMEAVKKGNFDVCKLLIEKGALVNLISGIGNTALHYAAGGKYTDLAKLLIKNGALVDKKNKQGFSPLHVAIQMGCEDVIKVLLEAKASPTESIAGGYTPLCLACQGTNTKIIDIFIKYTDINSKDQKGAPAICGAVMRGHCEIVNYLIDLGADLHPDIPEGYTLSHIAVMSGKLDMVNFIGEKIGVNMKMGDGTTPLHMAASQGNVEIVESLLKLGADLTVCNRDGKVALRLALDNKHHDVVKVLAQALQSKKQNSLNK